MSALTVVFLLTMVAARHEQDVTTRVLTGVFNEQGSLLDLYDADGREMEFGRGPRRVDDGCVAVPYWPVVTVLGLLIGLLAVTLMLLATTVFIRQRACEELRRVTPGKPGVGHVER